jgi:hypothetical protein
MSNSPDDPIAAGQGPHGEDDVYGISETDLPAEDLREVPMFRKAPVNTVEAPPPPPSLPFVTGVFPFLLYVKTLAVWLLGSIGLTIGLLLCLLCVYLVEIGLTVAARCLAVPSLWLTAFPLGYLSVCALNVIEQTSHGYDRIDDWSVGEWREWLWSFGHTLGAVVPALLVGAAVGALPLIPTSWAMAVAVFLLYPVFLLSALDNGSLFAPISATILRSFGTAWRGWLILYGQTGAMIGGWTVLSLALFRWNPFLSVVLATPPMVAMMLLYARLLGRLVWYMGELEEE